MLEEIRLASVDAFLSLPHGGAEIGGILCGTRHRARVRILAQRPLACEHALGPTFLLSAKDHLALDALLEEGCRDLRAQGLEPVGWYHSHTRSEIFLSPQDVEIHARHFPKPWHVALVVRPHIMQPVRAGLFFREADGTIHAAGSYAEFLLKPIAQASAAVPVPNEPEPPTNEPKPGTNEPKPVAPHARHWRWLLSTAALLLAIAVSAALLPRSCTTMPNTRPPVGLSVHDVGGELEIRWDRSSQLIRSAQSGTLEISEGAHKIQIALAKAQLQNATLVYARTARRVDLHLTLTQPNGQTLDDFAIYIARIPMHDLAL